MFALSTCRTRHPFEVPRARGREIDLAVAACAIADGASLWTLNRDDFRDIPGLKLI